MQLKNAMERWGAGLCWEDWAQWLEGQATTVTPGELHGLISGVLAGGKKLSPALLLRMVQAHMVSAVIVDAEGEQRLLNLYQCIQEQLQATDFSYYPGIPEEEPLRCRIEELAHWCQGFLVGVGTALKAIKDKDLEPEVREALIAITEISRVDPEQIEERADFSLMEIEEFLKVTVLMIFVSMTASQTTGESL